MKLLLLIALLVVSTFSAATSKSYNECVSKINITCDADCVKESEKCSDLTGDVMKSDECVDYLKEAVKHAAKLDENKEWSEEMGERFHECQ